MRSDYKDWLLAQEYSENTRTTQLHRVAKVEQSYGSLDDSWAHNGFETLIAELTYTSADERAGKPNPSKINFDGSIRNNLQSYKSAIIRYGKFLAEGPAIDGEVTALAHDIPGSALTEQRQKLSLERDMQAALRREIGKLEPGLVIVDDGAERAVTSGFIDILCRDAEGRSVVVELKAGKTDARVVGQILGYVGDVMDEDGAREVRAIIVAHDFDQRTISAARAVPNLALMRYTISFTFEALG